MSDDPPYEHIQQPSISEVEAAAATRIAVLEDQLFEAAQAAQDWKRRAQESELQNEELRWQLASARRDVGKAVAEKLELTQGRASPPRAELFQDASSQEARLSTRVVELEDQVTRLSDALAGHAVMHRRTAELEQLLSRKEKDKEAAVDNVSSTSAMKSERLQTVEARSRDLAKQVARLRSADSRRDGMAERIKALERELNLKDRQLQQAENKVSSVRAADEKIMAAVQHKNQALESELAKLRGSVGKLTQSAERPTGKEVEFEETSPASGKLNDVEAQNVSLKKQLAELRVEAAAAMQRASHIAGLGVQLARDRDVKDNETHAELK